MNPAILRRFSFIPKGKASEYLKLPGKFKKLSLENRINKFHFALNSNQIYYLFDDLLSKGVLTDNNSEEFVSRLSQFSSIDYDKWISGPRKGFGNLHLATCYKASFGYLIPYTLVNGESYHLTVSVYSSSNEVLHYTLEDINILGVGEEQKEFGSEVICSWKDVATSRKLLIVLEKCIRLKIDEESQQNFRKRNEWMTASLNLVNKYNPITEEKVECLAGYLKKNGVEWHDLYLLEDIVRQEVIQSANDYKEFLLNLNLSNIFEECCSH